MSAHDGGDELKLIREKLKAFENNLQELLAATHEDLIIAEQLQKVLMPNRLPEVPGLRCLARYIPAHQISAEGFDIIPTKDGRQIWFITSWAESFGLSSLLPQAMVHLQSKAMVESRPKLSPTEVFNDLSVSLSQAKKNSGYRLSVARLDTASLNVTGVSIGCTPLFKRSPHRNQVGSWELVQPEALLQNFSLFSPAQSAAPTLAENAYHFSFTLEPGARLYWMSSEWNRDAKSLADFMMPLQLTLPPATGSKDLIDDLNHLMMKAEDFLGVTKRSADISAVVVEVDQKKLHLA